jgi:hypothetical protein
MLPTIPNLVGKAVVMETASAARPDEPEDHALDGANASAAAEILICVGERVFTEQPQGSLTRGRTPFGGHERRKRVGD